MARKILITGGAGFVGRHIARPFLEAGDEVHCVDPLVPHTGAINPARWPGYRPLEFRNFIFHQEDCRTFFERRGDTDFDYCLHLAAIVGGRAKIESDPLAAAENLSIDAAYWRWASQARPAKTVLFSSSAVYPVSYQTKENYRLLDESMVGEDQFGAPDGGYGWSKLSCEFFARAAHAKYGLRSVVYRPFSGYGEDQDDSYPFPSICKRAVRDRGASQLSVWGTGDQMRDFIHIEDCVRAVLMTMDRIDNGEALNLSTGLYTSFRKFAALTAEILGYQPDIVETPNTPEGVFARAGCTAKQSKYSVLPQVSLREGIERALRYYLSL